MYIKTGYVNSKPQEQIYYYVVNLKQKQEAYIEHNMENLLDSLRCVSTLEDLKKFAEDVAFVIKHTQDEKHMTEILDDCGYDM